MVIRCVHSVCMVIGGGIHTPAHKDRYIERFSVCLGKKE